MAIRELASPQKVRPNRLQMSYEEYLQWVDEDTHAEWVEGEVIIHMPAKPEWLWEPDADPQLRFYEMAGMPAETIEQIRRQLQAGFQKPGESGPE